MIRKTENHTYTAFLARLIKLSVCVTIINKALTNDYKIIMQQSNMKAKKPGKYCSTALLHNYVIRHMTISLLLT